MLDKIILTLALTFSGFCYSQNWQALGTGADQGVYTMYTDTASDLLYIGGEFKNVNGIAASGISTWDGLLFDSLESGVDKQISLYPGPVRSIAKYSGKIYAGGSFTVADDFSAKSIGSWDGTQWDSSGQFDAPILQLLANNSDLYACGAFATVDGLTCNSIAKYDGSNWSVVGDNRIWNTGVITCMAFYKGELYIGGNFYDSPSGIRNIAKWNGTTWVAPGGIGIYGPVSSVLDMKVYNNELYVGGLFKKSDGNIGTAVVKWDSISWTDPGGGMTGVNARVQWMEIHNSYLYACGIFNTAGGVPAMGLARWDGTDWCGFGTTFDNNVLSVAFLYDTMYVAGGFWTISGDPMSRISKYIGPGPDTCGHLSVGINEQDHEMSFSVYPNPSNSTLQLVVNNLQEDMTYRIFNSLGQLVKTDRIVSVATKIDIESMRSGMYLIEVQSDEKIAISRFIKND